MSNPFSRTPFFLLLIPLVIGILSEYYFEIHTWSIVLLLFGGITMLFSYFIPHRQIYSLRWLFGLGTNLFLIGIGIVATHEKINGSTFDFRDNKKHYRIEILDLPQEKEKTTAYKVNLTDYDKKIICYFLRNDSVAERFSPGDNLIIYSRIDAFRNINKDSSNFDYPKYMNNKEFVGSAFIALNDWSKKDIRSHSLSILASKCRKEVLLFYKSLNLEETEFSILSALTLGYKEALSDETKGTFRNTGTAHVLAVSGLHVGYIYAIISLLLSFIKRNGKLYFLKPVIIILLLWAYAFITGLSPSVVRACSMLTIFCASEIFKRKSFSIHNLIIAIFFILLIDPLSIFDIGFQLSASATFFILWLHPHFFKLIKTKNRILKYIWQLFALSCIAQLGTLPLCIYYFGTFPTYFFISNLVVVPLAGLIIITAMSAFLLKGFGLILPIQTEYLLFIPTKGIETITKLMIYISKTIEQLPFATFSGISITLPELFCITFAIIASCCFILYKSKKYLIYTIGISILGIAFHLFDFL